jgi:hypothetical protein
MELGSFGSVAVAATKPTSLGVFILFFALFAGLCLQATISEPTAFG